MPGIAGISGIDPSVFIDHDGQGYLYWGQGSAKCAKLTPDMTDIDRATIKDGIRRARTQLRKGPGLKRCAECDAPIPAARRKAVPGVRHCVACQETLDREQAQVGGMNRRASKDSLLR